MFQVASPVHHFPLHGHGHHSMSAIAPSVQLPRTLSRPQFSEVSRESISAVAPELANVPPEYIRRGLRAKASQYVGLFRNCSISLTLKCFSQNARWHFVPIFTALADFSPQVTSPFNTLDSSSQFLCPADLSHPRPRHRCLKVLTQRTRFPLSCSQRYYRISVHGASSITPFNWSLGG